MVQSVGAALDLPVARLVLAAALGLFMGLEREWSRKPAGIRTFSLVSLAAAVFTVLEQPLLVVAGSVLVIAMGAALAVRGLLRGGGDGGDEDVGLSLTTSVSLLVAYGVGSLVAAGYTLEGVTVAVLSSLLLVLKRELHGTARALSREEVRAAAEFAILAFVVFPLLPAGRASVEVAGLSVGVAPRDVWLLVVFVAGIGIANYAIVETYGGRGIAVTGFFGGLASSTAVVGTMLDHVNRRPAAADYGLAAILLADAAMALRNLAIAVAFTLSTGVLVAVIAPLVAVAVGGVAVAARVADWSERVDLEIDSPFTLRYALGFGALFLGVVVAGDVAAAQFGAVGLLVTAALAGLVSSAGATASAVLLYANGSVEPRTAALAILLATASSIAVKAGLTLAAPDRGFARRVVAWSGAVLLAGGVVAVTTLA